MGGYGASSFGASSSHVGRYSPGIDLKVHLILSPCRGLDQIMFLRSLLVPPCCDFCDLTRSNQSDFDISQVSFFFTLLKLLESETDEITGKE